MVTLWRKSIFEEGDELCRIEALDQLINTIHSSLSSTSVCSTKHFGMA